MCAKYRINSSETIQITEEFLPQQILNARDAFPRSKLDRVIIEVAHMLLYRERDNFEICS